ncbi:MAG: restriction endonuclease subunit S [Thiomonas sp.]|nr:restriction endonuclease subunit S [Thiomonas sp.]
MPDLVGQQGVFVDGDWVESKDQDPHGEVRLVQLADIGDGRFLNKSNRYLTQVKATELGCTFLEKGDVLIARMPDPLGRACIFPGDKKRAVTVVDVCVVRGKGEGFDHAWLMHFVNSAPFRESIHSLQSGSTRKRISRGNLSTLELPVPPRKEQTRIVAKLEELLSDLDVGVAELKAAQKKLAQYRQSLLKAAVEGALTAEWRATHTPLETGAQLLQRILLERRARWEAKQLAKFQQQGKTPPKDWQKKYPKPVQPDTTRLPQLPVGWVWSALGESFQVEVGATPSRKESGYWNGGIHWVSSGEVRFSRITHTKETISEAGLRNSSTQINPVGSVLLGMIGEGKTRGQVAILDVEATNNQNCAAIWASASGVPPEYVYYWLWSQYEVTRRGSSGNNQPALNKSIVERIPFPLAPLAEMKAVVQIVDCELKRADEQERAIELALKQSAAQRQNILRAAFSGQLVPQDPNDEPASVLLARIRTERAAREAAKKPRSRKSASSLRSTP